MKLTKSKKIGIIIGLVLLVVFFCFLGNKNKDNIGNGKFVENFESIDSWKIYDYEKDYLGNRGSDILLVNGYEGKGVLISGDVLNDTRIYKKLKVQPDSYYKLSVMIKAETYSSGKGANISAINAYEAVDVKNTYGEWIEKIVYIKTLEKQKEIEFSLGLGGYSDVSKGFAYFDNLSIEKISNLPEGEEAISFTNWNDTNSEEEKDDNLTGKVIFTCVVIFLVIFSIFVMNKNVEVKNEKYKLDKFDYIILFVLTLVCFLISFYELGDNFAPSSFWKSGKAGEYIIVELDEVTSIDKIAYYGNIPNDGYYNISFSLNDENYISHITLGENISSSTLVRKKKEPFFEWGFSDLNFKKCKYIKVESVEPGYGINELGFFTKNDDGNYELIPFTIKDVSYTKDSVGTPEMLFDEQDLVPDYKSYKNSTYFDEVYFPRTAYEQLNGWPIYETTHPPFGKILISIGITIFGMNPFGWRVMGTLFGALLVPLMYLFAIKIFKNRKYAFIATFLILFDFMRFSHSRLATIDSFSTFFVLCMYFFMFDYFVNSGNLEENAEKNGIQYAWKTKEQKKKFMKSLKPLLFCGIMFGFGAATKWSCVYAGAGLAFVFFLKKFFEFWKIRKIRRVRESWFTHNFIPTCLWCVLFFIIIPVIIYSASYIVYMPSNPNQSLFEIIIENQKDMYNYHSTLKESHDFQSSWWSWPFDIRPIWLYAGYDLPDGEYATIASFGNPAVWIPSAIFVLVSLIFTLKDKDKRGLILLIAYAFQYIPWVLTTRCTFIYAYFIPLPFSILLFVYCMQKIMQKLGEKNKIIKIILESLLILYLIVVLVLFIMFFPVISGIPASDDYISSLKWFETWYF